LSFSLQPAPLQPVALGNPFKVSLTTADLFSRQQPQQPLQQQPTAGGLERLPTVPVFPQTQTAAARQQALNGAAMQLQQPLQTGHWQQWQAELPSLI
jgi:hypothetical protein